MRLGDRARVAATVALLLPSALHAQESALERYVRMGVEANLELRALALGARRATAEWHEARGHFLPALQVNARYSRSVGGRSFVLPLGDLLNPVHAALNQTLADQGRAGGFPMIENQTIQFLRDREQDTRVRVTQVIWDPALRNDVRSRRSRAEAGAAGVDATRGRLVRDIKVAYYNYANAGRAVSILDGAVDLVRENERSSDVLFQASLVTRDRVHRARAERLEVEQDRARAETDRVLAASYFNYLLDRAPDAPIELDEVDLTVPKAVRSGSLAATGASSATAWIDSLADAALGGRAEIRQLDHAAEAAEFGVQALRGATLPSVALAADAGIQGRDYGFGSGDRFLMASLVVSWNITGWGAERSRVRQASLELERIRTQRDNIARQIALEVESAARNGRLALESLAAARERVHEAAGAFRLVSRRQDEGLATALEFIDARGSLTKAQLNEAITETELLIRLAELDYATGSHQTPVRSADEETER